MAFRKAAPASRRGHPKPRCGGGHGASPGIPGVQQPTSARPALSSSRRSPRPRLSPPSSKAPRVPLAAGRTPVALGAQEQPPGAGASARTVLTLTTTPRFHLRLQGPCAPCGLGPRAPTSAGGGKGKGPRAGDAVAQPDAVAEGLLPCGGVPPPSSPGNVPAAVQKKSLPPKSNERQARTQLFPLSGSADGTAS